MDQNQSSDVALTSDGDHTLLNQIDQNHLTGLGAMLVGITQVLLGMGTLPQFSGLTVSFWASIFLAGGGWALIGIGFNVFRGREAFDGGWIESEWVNWVYTVVTFVILVGLTATAAFTLLT